MQSIMSRDGSCSWNNKNNVDFCGKEINIVNYFYCRWLWWKVGNSPLARSSNCCDRLL